MIVRSYLRQLSFSSKSSSRLLNRLMAAAASSSSPVKEQCAIKLLGDQPQLDPKSVSNDQWKRVLSTEQYAVTRESATEPPFTGVYDKHFKPGDYHCICCGAELFESDFKFNSGCGWPAFSASKNTDQNIVRIADNQHGMQRVEVRCKKCDAHLGHVFDDGPLPTGERYCINSASLGFTSK